MRPSGKMTRWSVTEVRVRRQKSSGSSSTKTSAQRMATRPYVPAGAAWLSRGPRTRGAAWKALRLCSPVQFVFRQLRQAESFQGEDLPDGTVVVCMIHAASRDGRQFPDPHRFDITRPGLRQANLAFGYGAHHCLGAVLGRLEGREALTALLPLLENFDIDRSDLRLDRSAFTRAYERVRMVRRVQNTKET